MKKFSISHEEVNQMYDDAMVIVESRRDMQSGQPEQPGESQGSLVEQIRQMAQAKLGRPPQ